MYICIVYAYIIYVYPWVYAPTTVHLHSHGRNMIKVHTQKSTKYVSYIQESRARHIHMHVLPTLPCMPVSQQRKGPSMPTKLSRSETIWAYTPRRRFERDWKGLGRESAMWTSKTVLYAHVVTVGVVGQWSPPRPLASGAVKRRPLGVMG